MTGQYPFADLHYRDPALPVDLSLSAFTPFAPLDTALSSLPLSASSSRRTTRPRRRRPCPSPP